jgi:hypothetical protein
MDSPLAKFRIHSPETITRARFWNERKWHWMIDTIVFTTLGLACAWPIINAGGAMLELVQRLTP